LIGAAGALVISYVLLRGWLGGLGSFLGPLLGAFCCSVCKSCVAISGHGIWRASALWRSYLRFMPNGGSWG
jgi:ABC-type branched-subunit amino acid transport system permease subunit